ncbi:MAG: GNAT family N-acetyltransferase [Planctomycetota bacterium]|jgi:ribosomal protein S18 acetylase RimI-like enzyme
MEVRQLSAEDLEQVLDLWNGAEGIGLDNDCDTKNRIALYLQRNPGMSFCAWADGRIIAAVLCGHDGRRGYMQHLVVAPEYRGKGIGRTLVNKVMAKLRILGIRRCNIFVYTHNTDALRFWEYLGWTERTDLKVLSQNITL